MYIRVYLLISVYMGLLCVTTFAQADSNESLSLEVAIQKAVANNPELVVLEQELSALTAVKKQSGLMPNPEVETEIENILGGGEFSGVQGSEISVVLSQEFILGGKLEHRVRVADMDIRLAQWDYIEKKREIIAEIREVFISTLLKQKQIETKQNLIQLSEKFISDLEQQVKIGKTYPAEVMRAKLELSRQNMELQSFEAEIESDFLSLHLLLYDSTASYTYLSEPENFSIELPEYDSLLSMVDKHPNLARFSAESDKLKAEMDLQGAYSIPNVTVSAGYKRMNDISANTFMLGASMPLPLFDKNEGAIEEAIIRYNQNRVDYDATRSRLLMRIKLLYQQYTILRQTAETLKTVSIPQAEEMLSMVQEGYSTGRFTTLDVLDTQRTLFEIESEYVQIISEAFLIKTKIEGLLITEFN